MTVPVELAASFVQEGRRTVMVIQSVIALEHDAIVWAASEVVWLSLAGRVSGSQHFTLSMMPLA